AGGAGGGAGGPRFRAGLWERGGLGQGPVGKGVFPRLCESRDPRTAVPLMMRVNDPKLGDAATKALKALGPAAEAEITKALDDRDPAVRQQALRALKAVGAGGGDPDPEPA